ncbi:hypothetical protein E2C01_031653 [Portunus trituberculatus]|uniref:Uncharacterized protein n=1 Tax=Portunus trituberculatus TaxID=210409 RepID=A0A5B7EYP5_PORTR|nr:hypothetical protein [Portunus trituberculatus]
MVFGCIFSFHLRPHDEARYCYARYFGDVAGLREGDKNPPSPRLKLTTTTTAATTTQHHTGNPSPSSFSFTKAMHGHLSHTSPSTSQLHLPLPHPATVLHPSQLLPHRVPPLKRPSDIHSRPHPLPLTCHTAAILSTSFCHTLVTHTPSHSHSLPALQPPPPPPPPPIDPSYYQATGVQVHLGRPGTDNKQVSDLLPLEIPLCVPRVEKKDAVKDHVSISRVRQRRPYGHAASRCDSVASLHSRLSGGGNGRLKVAMGGKARKSQGGDREKNYMEAKDVNAED